MLRRKLQHAGPKAARLMDLWHCHLRNLAFDAGLIDSNPSYTKFVILGTARTGSNYLRGLLNSHRQIIAFGEIFRCCDTIGWDFAHVPQSQDALSLVQNEPVKFLEKKVFGNFPKHVSAVGFKIFYYHAHDSDLEPIWSYLRDHEEIKVIHIKRWNFLKTYLSKKKAMNSHEWVRRNSKGTGSHEPILLSYEDCLEAFTQTSEWEQQYDSFFEKHEMIEVLYENLSRDYVSEMRNIQDFLGVSHKAVYPETTKQSNRPLSDSIVNYFELKEKFVNSPYEAFFEN